MNKDRNTFIKNYSQHGKLSLLTCDAMMYLLKFALSIHFGTLLVKMLCFVFRVAFPGPRRSSSPDSGDV